MNCVLVLCYTTALRSLRGSHLMTLARNVLQAVFTLPPPPHSAQKHFSQFLVTGRDLLQNWFYAFDSHWENWRNASLFTLTRKFRVKPEAASSNVQGMMEHILTLFLALFFYPHSIFAFIWSSICFLPLHEFLEVAANQFWKGYGSR